MRLAFRRNWSEEFAMSYMGKVKNGVVVMPPEAHLPDGTEVEVIPRSPPEATNSFLD